MAELDKVAGRLRDLFNTEKQRLDKIDAYLRGKHDGPYQPRAAGAEYRKLVSRATTNMLPLVVTVRAQALFVEGFRTAAGDTNSVGWQVWQANGFDRRQTAVYRAALNYGTAYVTVLPGDPLPVIRGVSPRKMIAVYDDPAEDDWPIYALRQDSPVNGQGRYRLYDDTNVYTLEEKSSGLTITKTQKHGAGVCPVVRFCDDLDLDGRSTGRIEPLMVLQDRLDQTVFDLLMTQTFASWKVRTVAGMEIAPELSDAQRAELTDEQVAARKVRLAQDRFLVAEDEDTKFGTLDETPLDGFIAAVELVERQIATTSQTPPHSLLGHMVNLSAEALAAAEAGWSRDVEELKHTFGESDEQMLRLAALLAGDEAEAQDMSSQVIWRDMESRSMAQTADALGKIAQMLGVPVQLLWSKIPGFTQADIDEAKRLAAENDVVGQLTAVLNRQDEPALPAA